MFHGKNNQSPRYSLVRLHQRCRDHFIVLSVWVHMTQMASVWTPCIFASKLKYSGKSGNLRMFRFSRRPDYIPLEISRCPGSFYMFKCSAAGKTGKFKRIDNKLPFSHLISRFLRKRWDWVYYISRFFYSLLCQATTTWLYSSAPSFLLLLWWIPDFYPTWLTGRALNIWNCITRFPRCLSKGNSILK